MRIIAPGRMPSLTSFKPSSSKREPELVREGDDIELSARIRTVENVFSMSEENSDQEETDTTYALLIPRVRQPRRARSQGIRQYIPTLPTRLGRLLRYLLMAIGLYQIIIFLLSLLDALSPDNAASVLTAFGVDRPFDIDTASEPGTTLPISCHSHNDYWRIRPLYTALEVGCISVEADVWLQDGDLLVGHTRPSLSKDRTLETLYLNPILEILDRRNLGLFDVSKDGVFESDPAHTLVLLIDFKRDGEAIWPILNTQLEPLRQRDYLTHFNGTDVVEGPVTVVVSGDATFSDVIRSGSHRDVFYDAPLHLMGDDKSSSPLKLDGDSDYSSDYHDNEGVAPGGTTNDHKTSEQLKHPLNAAIYSPANSYYASTSFTRSIGYPWHSRLSHDQIEKIRSQIRGAHQRGLKVRYWNVPTWPLGVRNYLWRVLVREGVDVLSVNQVKAVTRTDWGPRKGGWSRKWWP